MCSESGGLWCACAGDAVCRRAVGSENGGQQKRWVQNRSLSPAEGAFAFLGGSTRPDPVDVVCSSPTTTRDLCTSNWVNVKYLICYKLMVQLVGFLLNYTFIGDHACMSPSSPNASHFFRLQCANGLGLAAVLRATTTQLTVCRPTCVKTVKTGVFGSVMRMILQEKRTYIFAPCVYLIVFI